jgi:hypothetical protein
MFPPMEDAEDLYGVTPGSLWLLRVPAATVDRLTVLPAGALVTVLRLSPSGFVWVLSPIGEAALYVASFSRYCAQRLDYEGDREGRPT